MHFHKGLCSLLFLSTIIIASNFVVEISSEKILFLLPISTKSHKNIFDPLIKEMAKKGHEIFVMSAVLSSGMPENVEEFVPVSIQDIFDDFTDVFEQRKKSGFSRLLMNTDFLTNACHKIFQHPKTKEMLETKRNYYDLIVVDTLGNQCIYGMLVHLGSPVMSIVTFPPPNTMVENLGLHFPYSFVPSPFLPFSDRMSFPERMANTFFQMVLPLIMHSKYTAGMEAVYKQYLGDHMPDSNTIEANFSAMLINAHFSMNYPRPLLPEIVEIGGIHCKPAKPLPKDLEEFLSGTPEGFIYFSFGSVVKSAQMPEEIRKAFINALASLKQRVLWKWDQDHMEDLPKNVKIIKWAPQQDILGHKNIKLFISHGGLLSSQEAVYHGVPVLNIPFFGDQDLNSKANVHAGFALSVEIIGLTEDTLRTNINQILEDPKFYKRAKEISAVFKDQPRTPLESAVYWTEYVMKYKGAHHLRSASRELSYFQYHSLDVIAFLVFSVVVILLSILKCFKQVCRCFGSKKHTPSKKNALAPKKNN